MSKAKIKHIKKKLISNFDVENSKKMQTKQRFFCCYCFNKNNNKNHSPIEQKTLPDTIQLMRTCSCLWRSKSMHKHQTIIGTKSFQKKLSQKCIQDNHCCCCCRECYKLTFSVLLSQSCLDMWGLFYNLGFSRCAFYVAGSQEFRCRCPRRWAVRQVIKSAFETSGRLMPTWQLVNRDQNDHFIPHQMKASDGNSWRSTLYSNRRAV